jgi:hypothetical protein
MNLLTILINRKMSRRENQRQRDERISRQFAAAFAHIAIPPNIMEEHPAPRINPTDSTVEAPDPDPPEDNFAALVAEVENLPVLTAEEQNPPQPAQAPAQALAPPQQNHPPRQRNENITIETIRDSIVSNNTNKSYNGDLVHFLSWVYTNENNWLTDHGRTGLADIIVRREDESKRQFRIRRLLQAKALLRDSFDHPIIRLGSITAPRYLDYLLTLRRHGGELFLSKSSYGNKRASLFHLFRLHNRIGYDTAFNAELSTLLRGFYRQITQQRAPAPPLLGNDDDRNENAFTCSGKEPMSVELYKALCRWLLDFGTVDGVFAYCYLVLTWNLSCRAGNTARIQFRDISWSSCFDCFSVMFAQSKTDQLGEEAKYCRHLYANPNSPLVCPVVALSLYLTCCFNTQQEHYGLLFPGTQQESRFGDILGVLIKSKWDEISGMGYKLGDLGTHSIRKGAVSYLSSLPGGPPVAATCIRAGWTMGKVKDVYMRYAMFI